MLHSGTAPYVQRLRQLVDIDSDLARDLEGILQGANASDKEELERLESRLRRDLHAEKDEDAEQAAIIRKFLSNIKSFLHKRRPVASATVQLYSTSTSAPTSRAVTTTPKYFGSSFHPSKRRSPQRASPEDSPDAEVGGSPGKRLCTSSRRSFPVEPASPTQQRSIAAHIFSAGPSFSARGMPQRSRTGPTLAIAARDDVHARLDRAAERLTLASPRRSDAQHSGSGSSPSLSSGVQTPTELPPSPNVSARSSAQPLRGAVKPISAFASRLQLSNDIAPAGLRLQILQNQKDGRRSVPWGTQMHLVHLVTHGIISWDDLDIGEGINALRSESSLDSMRQFYDRGVQRKLWSASGGAGLLASHAITPQEVQTFAELDREAEALLEDRFAGVGTDRSAGVASYGGKVHFEAVVSLADRRDEPAAVDGKYLVRLDPPRLGPSLRLARRFGSERILRLKIAPPLLRTLQRQDQRSEERKRDFLAFLRRPLRILGRDFRPFQEKDGTVVFFQVAEQYPSAYPLEIGSIFDLYDHHGPWEANRKGPMGKYLQRMALALSTSTPAALVDELIFEKDGRGDASASNEAGMVMTDGAAAASHSLFRAIADAIGYPVLPSAIQARIGGAKGVWYLRPDPHLRFDADAPRSVTVRDSQKKLILPPLQSMDPSHRVVDLLTPAKAVIPTTLSKQILMVLDHAGVPAKVFTDLQREQLSTIVERATDWEGDDDDVRHQLAKLVDELGSVEKARLKRSMQVSEQRANGLRSRVDDDQTASSQGSDLDRLYGPDGRHMWSGKPLSRAEQAYDLLLSGFKPATNPKLADEIEHIAKQAMDRIVKKFAMPIAQSGEAMCIPDPVGVLAEGEVQFRFASDGIVDPDTKLKIGHVPEGDVLVTRHPCLLPTDIQKVHAVVRSELAHYKDVIVFSTKGKRPLADLLSGGDYDGDLIRCYWDPRIVAPFRNAPEHFANCPFKLDEMFDINREKVEDFMTSVHDMSTEDRDVALIERVVESLFSRQLRGMYGNMHLVASYSEGCDSTEAVSLAHKFNQCMDSAKTGLELKESVRIEDSKRYNRGLPAWDDKDDDLQAVRREHAFELSERGTLDKVKRSKRLGPSVLDVLWQEGKTAAEELKKKLKADLQAGGGALKQDVALSRRWKEAVDKGRLTEYERPTIESHVQTMLDCISLTCSQNARDRQQRSLSIAKGDLPAQPRRKLTLGRSRGMQRTKSAPWPAGSQKAGATSSGSDNDDRTGKLGKRGMTRFQSDVGSTQRGEGSSADSDLDDVEGSDDWLRLYLEQGGEAELSRLEAGKTSVPDENCDGGEDDVFVDADDGIHTPPPAAPPTQTPPHKVAGPAHPSTDSTFRSAASTSTESAAGRSTTPAFDLDPSLHSLSPDPVTAACSGTEDEDEDADGPPTDPCVLSSLSEVAKYFHIWPAHFRRHLASLDRDEVRRLERLRASYAYHRITTTRPPASPSWRYVIEIAWSSLLQLKAEETGARDGGVSVLPRTTMDQLKLRKKKGVIR